MISESEVHASASASSGESDTLLVSRLTATRWPCRGGHKGSSCDQQQEGNCRMKWTPPESGGR
eukprot:10935325-Alexandrium_andersonii.AAC.1